MNYSSYIEYRYKGETQNVNKMNLHENFFYGDVELMNHYKEEPVNHNEMFCGKHAVCMLITTAYRYLAGQSMSYCKSFQTLCKCAYEDDYTNPLLEKAMIHILQEWNSCPINRCIFTEGNPRFIEILREIINTDYSVAEDSEDTQTNETNTDTDNGK